MLKELQTWVKLKCFSRKLRKDARNIIDVRWVLKYIWDQETQDIHSTAQGAATKTIRARLTARGFKDVNKYDIERFMLGPVRGVPRRF